MKKRTIAFLLTLALFIGAMPMSFANEVAPSFDNFEKTNTYSSGQFSDVASSAWYAGGVKAAYEYNLVKGSSAGKFNPSGNMTIAEAIALAARIHSIYHTGKADFVQGSPWYQVYVDYALENDIIEDEYVNNNVTINRATFAMILAKAIPNSELNDRNNIAIGKIPDVTGSETYANSVYRLYNAGILTGSDKYGTFNAKNNIQRCEVATIATRMVNKYERKSFTLAPPEPTTVQLAGNTSIYVGETTQWKATIAPAKANQWVSWTSGNTGVATVDANGNIKGIRAGQSNITATAANGVKKTVLITVKSKSYPGYEGYPDFGKVFNIEHLSWASKKNLYVYSKSTVDAIKGGWTTPYFKVLKDYGFTSAGSTSEFKDGYFTDYYFFENYKTGASITIGVTQMLSEYTGDYVIISLQ